MVKVGAESAKVDSRRVPEDGDRRVGADISVTAKWAQLPNWHAISGHDK
jgi:hypothetical protein